MRIAIFHDLPSGGAKRTLYETMKRLSRNHTLDVYALDTADPDFCSLGEFSNAEVVFHFSPSRLFSSPLGRLNQLQRWVDLQRLDRLARRIAATIDKGCYDVVFAQPCMWTQAPLVLRHLRTPALYYCHEPPRHFYENPFRVESSRASIRQTLDQIDPFVRLYRATGRRLDKLAALSAKMVVVNSLYIRELVKNIYGVDSLVNYHGVDADVFLPLPRNGTGKYVLSVGAIQPHKGYGFLIESLGHIDKDIRPSLYLVGNMENASEQDFLLALAVERGVDLHIEVNIDLSSLIRMYGESALVAYAPYHEPFGLVPLEAMACGVPLVAVREGGIPETIVHEYTGFLVERDAKQFASAVQFLLTHPDLAAAYGRNGREHVVQNWGWERSVSLLESRLSECAGVRG